MMVNAYIIYKTLLLNSGVKPLSHYDFQRKVVLAKLDPETYGVQKTIARGARKKEPKKISVRAEKEAEAKRRKLNESTWKRSDSANVAKRSLTYSTKFEDHHLTEHGLLRRRLDQSISLWCVPLSKGRKGVPCQLCRWATGKKLCTSSNF